MVRMIAIVLALALIGYVSDTGLSYLSDSMSGQGDAAQAGALGSDINQIQGAIKLYRANEGKAPTIKDGQENTKSGNDLLKKGYLNTWPDGWSVDPNDNTIVNNSSNINKNTCIELRKDLGEPTSDSAIACDGDATDYPCCQK